MFKLVVLFAVLAIVAAKPSGFYGTPLAYSAVAAPTYAIPAAVSHQYRSEVVSKPVVATYAAPAFTAASPVTSYAAAPVVAPQAAYAVPTSYVAAPTVVEVAPAPAIVQAAPAPAVVKAAPAIIKSAPVIAQTPAVTAIASVKAAPVVSAYSVPHVSDVVPSVAAVPITGTTYTKNVHYAENNVITGYSAQVIKPNLGALVTPYETVANAKVLAPAHTVVSYVPTYTQIVPEVKLQKVETPTVSAVEVAAAPVAAGTVIEARASHNSLSGQSTAEARASPASVVVPQIPSYTSYVSPVAANVW